MCVRFSSSQYFHLFRNWCISHEGKNGYEYAFENKANSCNTTPFFQPQLSFTIHSSFSAILKRYFTLFSGFVHGLWLWASRDCVFLLNKLLKKIH